MEIERDFERPDTILVNFSAEEFDVFTEAARERIINRQRGLLDVFDSDKRVIEESKRTDVGRLRWRVYGSDTKNWLTMCLHEFIENTPYKLGELEDKYLMYKAYCRRRAMGEAALELVTKIESELKILHLTEDLIRAESPGDIEIYGS